MSSGAKDKETWDIPNNAKRSRRSQPATDDVPDEWDADIQEVAPDPKQVWEEANARAPMPEILITSTTSATAPPPNSAFSPSLRILKRPQSQSPKPTGPLTPQKTITEREADYQAARNRIFSAAESDIPISQGPSAEKRLQTGSGAVATDVVRQPRGPTSTSGRGFRSRRGRGTQSPKSPRDESPQLDEALGGPSSISGSPAAEPNGWSAD